MKSKINRLTILILIAFVLPSCVMKKKYLALEKSKNEIQLENEQLVKETNNQKEELIELKEKYNSLLADYNNLKDTKRENENLSQQEKAKIESDLKIKMVELEASNKKIKDLEAALNAQKSAMNELKSKIQNALKVLNNDNLTVERRGDKVYVSLPEDLLFSSGSAKVGASGKDALKKFAEVMISQDDIDIVVEGHTDSIPLNGSTIKDNWDLSVVRATSVVRILTEEYNLPSERITASGRSQYQPIASNSTKEGRAKNRRIEIVLAPKIVSLYELIE